MALFCSRRRVMAETYMGEIRDGVVVFEWTAPDLP
jgi:hypothetical protein